MDFKRKNVSKLDPRVSLFSYKTKDNTVEIYPAGSFTFEYFLYFDLELKHVYTTQSNSPNTFFTELTEQMLYSTCRAATTARSGQSAGFNFYESTTWKFDKKQHDTLPLLFLTHTVNYVNNLRWVFLAKVCTYKVKSVSQVYPAATWSEREIQDMFNVNFTHLKDTRRLLLEYKAPKGVLNANYTATGLPKYSTYYDLYYV